MARALRIQYPGAIYHVMNRGDRREDIYLDDKDRFCFLEPLCVKGSVEVRRLEADERHYKDLRRVWMMGSEEFRKELLEQTGKWLGPNHFGKERRQTAEGGCAAGHCRDTEEGAADL